MGNTIRTSREDKVFSIIAYTLATLAMVITLYPLLYCVGASFSDPLEVVQGKVLLFPRALRSSPIKQPRETRAC